MLEYREMIGFAQYIRDNVALGREHYEEIVRRPDIADFDLDLEKYEAMEAAGILAAVGAFDGDKLVGYSASVVTTHIHHKHLHTAINDLMFLSKPYRKGRAGLELRNATKQICKEYGAELLFWYAHTDTAWGKLLPRLGCTPQETIFSEPL